ncbi:MAG: hypothetical protein ABUL55_01720 [Pseudomonadota bacterium]
MNIFQFFAGLFRPRRDKRQAPTQATYERKYQLQRIPRYDGKGQPPAGYWAPCHPATMRRFKAQMTCTAGHALALNSHSIAEDGRVFPSIVCRAPGCDYHEIVRLDGWNFGSISASGSVTTAA